MILLTANLSFVNEMFDDGCSDHGLMLPLLKASEDLIEEVFRDFGCFY
jgi:hypothetical protein